jgi:hypothetical protein
MTELCNLLSYTNISDFHSSFCVKMCCDGRTAPGNRPFIVMFSRAWTPPANKNRQIDNNIVIHLRGGDGGLRPVSVVSCTKVANYSGANPASYSMSTGRLSPRIKPTGREVDHSPSITAEISTSLICFPGVYKENFTFIIYIHMYIYVCVCACVCVCMLRLALLTVYMY